MKSDIDYSIYLVTDRELMSSETLEEAVEQSIAGGTTLVQLREKTSDSMEFYNTAVRIKRITSRRNIPLIINDRVDIALAVDAEGVHVGQTDIPAAVVRHIIGDNKILGVSVSNAEEAIKAERDGADYLGVGAMFATDTKTNANIVTIEELARIRNNVSIPIVVIGGINEKTVPLFKGAGINGISVVSAIIAAKDITAAAKKLKKLFEEIH